jgi:hypothetical protein
VNRAIVLVLVLALLLPPLCGCAAVSAFEPPDWDWFDPVLYTSGGVPASLGYYLGVAVWSPAGMILAGPLPYPADETVAWAPGEGLGVALGVVLGAPFHLLALPFRWLDGGGEEGAGGEAGPGDAGAPPPEAGEAAPPPADGD